MLLTVRSFGGSVYVFDVSQGTFSAPQPPSVTTDGPYTLDPSASSASATLWMHAQGYDPAGVLLDYAWDLDGDGTFESAGQAAPIQLQALGGQSSLAVVVRVTSKSGLSATAQTTVQVAAAPVATP